MLRLICYFLFSIIFFPVLSHANYAAGGTLSYEFIGSSQYLVTYHVYRDCSGNPAPLTDSLHVNSGSCNESQTLVMNLISSVPFSNAPCLDSINTCQGGTVPGFQDLMYQAIVTLPVQCPDWIFSVSDCCMMNGFTTIQNPSTQNQYIEAGLNNVSQENNSPQFLGPEIYGCADPNLDPFLETDVIDIDGDSLVFSLEDAMSAPNTSTIYTNSFSGLNPITSSQVIYIDPLTGQIRITATDTTEVALISVKVREFRAGVFIGYTMITHPVLFVACHNAAPGIVAPPFIFTIEAGQQFCNDFISYDTDPYDTLTMSWNQGIPAATCVITGNHRPMAHFCWTPSLADVRPQPYVFVLYVNDDFCPVNSAAYYAFEIIVTLPTLISDLERKDELNLFPNPVFNKLTIENSGNSKISLIQLLDLSGKLIFPNFINEHEIDMLHIESGIYVLEIVLDDQSRFFKRVIKE